MVGATPATWKNEVERFLPEVVGARAASIAHTETSFGSYTASAFPKAAAKRVPRDESRNFSGLSFSFAQSGFPAE